MNSQTQIATFVSQAAKGNRIAQQEIYRQHCGAMLSLCVRMMGDRYIAEDVMQDGFIKVFMRLPQLKEPKKLSGWIKRIILNECMDQLKKVRHFEEVEEHDFEDEGEGENWFEGISFDQINDEIDRLSDGSRQVFTLYLIEDMKHREIAELLGVSVSTVKSQYQRALKQLRTRLKAIMI
ncbi:RNA polymerase sigma factor [Reichenbachiella versicolor]|uniref:RNA polymerase sigma factor n=1 Tax=Reichenbachiella versicolor TaxID=1821036 RepID=UPI000D6E68EE|nr:sigma-70 family RNA polymerase sigma factor [Reichenbachiella versicolor]